MPPPTEGQVNDFAWIGNAVQRFEGSEHHGALLFNIARPAERVTKRPLQVDTARRLYLLCVFTNDCYPNGGNAGFFDLSLDQSHGLIADASGRGEQNGIDPVGLELFYHLPGRLRDQGGNVTAVNMTHEGIVGVCELANDTFLL